MEKIIKFEERTGVVNPNPQKQKRGFWTIPAGHTDAPIRLARQSINADGSSTEVKSSDLEL